MLEHTPPPDGGLSCEMRSGPLTDSVLFTTVISPTEIFIPAGLSRIGSDINISDKNQAGALFHRYVFQYGELYHLFIIQREPILPGSHLF